VSILAKKSTSEPRLSDREFRVQAFRSWLHSHFACGNGLRFARSKTFREAWSKASTPKQYSFMRWAVRRLTEDKELHQSYRRIIWDCQTPYALRRRIKLPARFKFEKRPKSTSKKRAKR
jgi:hypothetical protein